MAYRVVLSDQAERSLEQLYVGARLRWEQIKRVLSANPNEHEGNSRITCHPLGDDRFLCKYVDAVFPRDVLYTVEPYPPQVIVRRFLERPPV